MQVVLFDPTDERRQTDTRAKKSVDGGEYAETCETSRPSALTISKGIKAEPAAEKVMLAEMSLLWPSARKFYREAPFESVIADK